MKLKTIQKGQELLVRGTFEFGLSKRGRKMIASSEQVVLYSPPNRYFGIELTHTSGPLKGLTLRFSEVKAKISKRLSNCTCSAYNFPHKQGLGKCQHPR